MWRRRTDGGPVYIQERRQLPNCSTDQQARTVLFEYATRRQQQDQADGGEIVRRRSTVEQFRAHNVFSLRNGLPFIVSVDPEDQPVVALAISGKEFKGIDAERP